MCLIIRCMLERISMMSYAWSVNGVMVTQLSINDSSCGAAEKFVYSNWVNKLEKTNYQILDNTSMPIFAWNYYTNVYSNCKTHLLYLWYAYSMCRCAFINHFVVNLFFFPLLQKNFHGTDDDVDNDCASVFTSHWW